MKPDQKMIVALTFLTGMLAGAALYILVYAPEFKAVPVEEKSGLSVVGEMYGGCNMVGSCPSFRLEEDGSYMFLVGDEKTEGELPKELTLETLSLLTDHRLTSHAAPVEKDDCDSFTDGIDYRYEIVLDKTRYVLDTCKSSLSYGSELQQQMNKVWLYLDDPNNNVYETESGGGLGGWAVRRLQSE